MMVNGATTVVVVVDVATLAGVPMVQHAVVWRSQIRSNLLPLLPVMVVKGEFPVDLLIAKVGALPSFLHPRNTSSVRLDVSALTMEIENFSRAVPGSLASVEYLVHYAYNQSANAEAPLSV